MIKIEENQKSEAQIRLEKKLERDKEKLQEQVKKDQKKIEELKRKAKSIIGEMFAEYLPDYYCFEGSELKEIVDTAMTQEAVTDKIAEIRSRSDAGGSAEVSKTVSAKNEMKDSGKDVPEISETESEEVTEDEPYEETDGDDESDSDEETDEDEESDSYDEES